MSSRQFTPKRWKTLIVAGTAAGLGHAAPLHAATDLLGFDINPGPVWITQTAGEAGEGGEGGESGLASESSQTIQLLTGLALIEGHLRAGIALYQAGEADMAKTHMKHPKAEIYTDLEPFLGDDGFADELKALAQAVEGGSDVEVANAAFNDVLSAITNARNEAQPSPRDQFDAMMATMRVAAEEYEIGVQEGAITNLHEYQDAWGFTKTTIAMTETLTKSPDSAVAAAAEKTLAALKESDAVFDGVTPQEPLTGDATILYGVAARIELAALSVK